MDLGTIGNVVTQWIDSHRCCHAEGWEGSILCSNLFQSIPKVPTMVSDFVLGSFCTNLHQKVMVKKGEADIPGLTVPRPLHSVSLMGWVR